MTTWFISRHPGAIAWAHAHNLGNARFCAHLDVNEVARGDTVIGTLPVHLAGQVCARGARFLALTMDVPENKRGNDISSEEMSALHCSLKEFCIVALPLEKK